MEKELEINVAKDHVESLTKVSGLTAITELIWNSLDADANSISIKTASNSLGIYRITINDDGHGMSYNTAQIAFSNIGGSYKKNAGKSPKNRVLHGKEGKGRLRAFALGDFITYKSNYRDSKLRSFEIKLDRNNIKHPIISDLSDLKKSEEATGVQVTIDNINPKAASFLEGNGFKELEERFAVYYMSYPTFKVNIDKRTLDFTSCIKRQIEDKVIFDVRDDEKFNGVRVPFTFKIIEWTRVCEKKIYYCSEKGISFGETALGIRTGNFHITVHILSKYIEELHLSNDLELGELNVIIAHVTNYAKDLARKYIRERKHEEARSFIDDLKQQGIYPFSAEQPKDKVEEAERQVFDIIALQLNEHLPSFTDQDVKGKKLTLSLIKEVLQRDSSGLEKIFSEVINLPQDKRDELTDILERTSLSTIVDTMKEISDRLRTIYELRLILFDKEVSKNVLERKHLHKIVKNESWLFGDDYTYGADDVNLRNVLKQYLKYLGRDDFESTQIDDEDSKLDDIPDICLWKQFNSGKVGHFENLIIELKRPTKTVGIDELEQIKKYARAIANDQRFPKAKTKWVFVLLTTKMNDDARSECTQKDREFGHIDSKENCEVFVKGWGDLLNEAEARHQYLKNKLNYNISEDEEGVKLLKLKYDKYLPAD